MALPEIPYDEWFDPKHKFEPHPYDNWPTATNKDKEDIKAELSLHEKMYRIATDKYNPFSVGGSESIHDYDK